MALEMQQKSFRKKVAQMQNKEITGIEFTEDEALEKVRKKVEEYLTEEIRNGGGPPKAELAERTQAFLGKLKTYYKKLTLQALEELNIRIQGYQSIEAFATYAVSEFVGYSVLEEAFNDPTITDIFVIAWDCIFVERNGQTPELYNKKFKDSKHLKSTIERLAREGAEKEPNNGPNKILDCSIYGQRYCITAPSITPRDYSITIRKHSSSHISLKDLLNDKVFSTEIANLIGTFLKGESNILICGITGSGKTTTLRAFLDYYISKLGRRMIVCEDERELFVSNPHTLELITVKSDNPALAVTLEKLVLTALRLKPKYITIGEVRGPEITAMVEAANTGHSTITSIHGDTWQNCVNRIIQKYLSAMPSLSTQAVEKLIGTALDYIIIQEDIPKIGRKITSITEISYDYDREKIVGTPIYEYNFDTNSWDRRALVSDEKLRKMRGRGVTPDDIQKYLNQPKYVTEFTKKGA